MPSGVTDATIGGLRDVFFAGTGVGFFSTSSMKIAGISWPPNALTTDAVGAAVAFLVRGARFGFVVGSITVDFTWAPLNSHGLLKKMSKTHPLLAAVSNPDDMIADRIRAALIRRPTTSQATFDSALATLVHTSGFYAPNSPALQDALQMLLERGADPNTPFTRGGVSSLLHFAYDNRRPDVVRILLAYGALPTRELIDEITYTDVAPQSPLYDMQLMIMDAFLARNSAIAERQAANILYRKFEKNTDAYVPENVQKYASKFMTQRSSSSQKRRTRVQKARARQTAKKTTPSVAGGGGN